MLKSSFRFCGFTLVELLIVMAVMGVLASSMLLITNPVEMMARARDAGRITAVGSLGRAVLTYYSVSPDGSYPPDLTWDQDLVTTQSVASFPAGTVYSANSVTACSSNAAPSTNPTYCYVSDAVNDLGVIVFSKLESTRQLIKCTSPEVPYIIFSTEDGKSGIICSTSDPSPWAAGSVTYVE